MKYQSILFAAAATLILGTQSARAEDEKKKEKDGDHKGGIEQYDTDKDGALSKAEIAAIPAKKSERLLEKLDTNKDGELSKEELAAHKGGKHEKKEGAEEKK